MEVEDAKTAMYRGETVYSAEELASYETPITKDISVERLYTIADYQNVKFISTLRGVPEEMAMNPKVVQLLFYSTFLECDIAYKNYMDLRQTMVKDKVTNVVEFLEEERNKTHNQLLEEIKKASEKE